MWTNTELLIAIAGLVTALCLAPAEEADPALAAIRHAQTTEIVFETTVAVQRELLHHYAAQLQKRAPELDLYVGLSYASTGDWRTAREWFEVAAKSDGKVSQRAKIWRAAADYAGGDKEAAAAEWDRARELNEAILRARVIRAQAEVGYEGDPIPVPEDEGAPWPSVRFVLAVQREDTQKADALVEGPLLDRPDATIPLGSIRFSDRTVPYDLSLYDPALLKWAVRLAWLKALRLAEDGPLWMKIRCLRGMGRTDAALDAGTDAAPSDASVAREIGAILYLQRKSAEAQRLWGPHIEGEDPAAISSFAEAAAALPWSDARKWIPRVQALLARSKLLPENRRLSQARFDDKYRDWIWLLAWLQFRGAPVPTESDDRGHREALDAALQILDIAYKRTERHSLRANRPLHLAWAGLIYYRAHRLDDFLYYPYSDEMLPKVARCAAVREYASRLQAILKLERPQLEDEPVQPVVHHSRAELLFGEGSAEAPLPSAAAPTEGNEVRRSSLFLVLAGAGLFLVILALWLGATRG